MEIWTGALWPGGYIGAVFLAGAYCAMGLFASALTRNQIIAFIIGCALCFTLTILNRMLFFVPSQIVGLIEYIGANTHFANFSKGVLDTRDIIYFLSLVSIFLFSTHLVMQEKIKEAPW